MEGSQRTGLVSCFFNKSTTTCSEWSSWVVSGLWWSMHLVFKEKTAWDVGWCRSDRCLMDVYLSSFLCIYISCFKNQPEIQKKITWLPSLLCLPCNDQLCAPTSFTWPRGFNTPRVSMGMFKILEIALFIWGPFSVWIQALKTVYQI